MIAFPLCNHAGIAAENTSKEPLNGILIEGMNFAGKSTVSKLIERKLAQKNIKTKCSYFYLCNNSLINFILKKALESEGTEEESIFYACGTLMDTLLFKAKPDIFYIQDSNWLSQECWLEFFSKGNSYVPENFILNTRQPFKWNVYLTISYECFKERYSQKEKRSILANQLFNHPETFHQYETFFLSKIPESENWIIIDTSFLSPNQVADQILIFCGTQ